MHDLYFYSSAKNVSFKIVFARMAIVVLIHFLPFIVDEGQLNLQGNIAWTFKQRPTDRETRLTYRQTDRQANVSIWAECKSKRNDCLLHE